MKICAGCKKELPITEFRKVGVSSIGDKWYSKWCCDCYKERKKQEWSRYKGKRDKNYFKEWGKNNKEKLRAKGMCINHYNQALNDLVERI